MKKALFLLISIVISFHAITQVVYEDINNLGIYEFLDELANLKVIEINSVVKPYSRTFIGGKLKEVLDRLDGLEKLDRLDERVRKLNKRQMKELAFYWQDYQLDVRCAIRDTRSELGIRNEELGIKSKKAELETRNLKPETGCLPEYDHKLGFLFKNKPNFAVPINPLAFQYKDKLFTFSLRPILGITYMANENGSALHKYWGGSMFGYIGKNFGFYASLRDNNESVGLEYPLYLSLTKGNVYKKYPNGGVDFFEMKGGITVSWNWGSFGLLNDRFIWGNNYHGANILSDKAPPYPYLFLHLKPSKWFEFSYMHGWLNSTVIDSSRSYYSGDVYRIVYHNKYIAANIFTFTPFKRLNLSFGNSIIYSDININPIFLIPFVFFNAVEATRSGYSYNAGSNSQLFFDISSRQIKHLHLYLTLFIDELKMSRVADHDLQNFTSWKAGFKLSDFPVSNLSFTFEWTKTNPMTYKHYISTTSFASNGFNMGNYLRDNSFEYYFALGYKPIRGLFIQASYILAARGDDYPYDYSNPIPVDQVPFIKNKTWQNSEIAVSARYEYTANAYFFLDYLNSTRMGDMGYQPDFMHGKTNTIVAGVNIGF